MYRRETNNKKANLAGVGLIASLLLVPSSLFADEVRSSGMTHYLSECKYMPTVLALANPPVKNNTVCIDMPSRLDDPKVVFNLDASLFDDKGRPIGLRHMQLVGTALLARVKVVKLDAKNASVVGVMHGGGLDWALDPNETPKHFIEEIYKLKNAGLDINLEVCGVTMQGKNKRNKDLYQSKNGLIHVNQGAVARIMDLQRHGYTYLQE